MTIQYIFVFLGFCVPFFLLTIWAVVSAAQKDFKTIGQKVCWVMIASIPFIGFIIYFLFGARKGKKPTQAGSPEN